MKIDKMFFRGKCAITGHWRYGYYYYSKGHSIIRSVDDEESIVLKKTVGRYTCIRDCNERPIFEGDIVVIPATMHHIEIKGIVIFKNGGFCVKSLLTGTTWDLTYKGIKIISNVYVKQ